MMKNNPTSKILPTEASAQVGQHSTFPRPGIFIFYLFIFILFTACPEDPDPDPRDTSIFMELESTWTTSLTLKVSVADTSDYWRFSLSRDDSTVGAYTVYGNDTLIKDGGLEPNRDYTYRAFWLDNGEVKDSSNQIIATTMDTTSHHFTWTIDTLGGYGSYLRDVAIVDENNIWVVGNIVTDSGQYNAAHWDGNEWELIAIKPQGYLLPIQCIFYFNDNDIWFGQSGLPIQWNGQQYYLFTPNNSTHPGQPSIDAIWGSAPDDIYFVGNSGSIVHYDGGPSQGGQGFERLESGTEVDLLDVTGTDNGSNVFITGMNLFFPGGSILLELNKQGLHELYNVTGSPIDSSWVRSIDVYGDTAYISTTSNLWKYNYKTTESTYVNPVEVHPNADGGYIRTFANSSTDILLTGAAFRYFHFNGMSYVYNQQFYDSYPHCVLMGADYKHSLLAMVGHINWSSNAIVIRGLNN